MGLRIQRVARVKVLSTLIAVFALVAQPLYGAISAQVANAVGGSVSGVDASYVKDAGYTGIYVGFDVENASTAVAVEVRANRSNGTTYSMTAQQPVVDNIKSAAAKYSTGGTLIVTGSRTSGSWTPQTGTWSGSSIPVSVDVIVTLQDGAKLIGSDLTIRDNGATLDDVMPVPVDTTAPNVHFQLPIEGKVVSGDIHTRSRVDNEAGTVHRVTYIDGIEFKNETTSSRNSEIKFNTASYTDGAHTIRVVATDEAGNAAEATQTFVIDNTKPTVKVNLNRSAYVTSDGVAGSVQKPEIEAFDKHLTKIEVWKNGTKVTEWSNVNKDTVTYKGINWLGEGTYVIRAYDQAGLASDDFTVTIDNTAPTSTNNLPTLVSGTVNVTQSLTDNVKAASGKLRIWKLKADSTQDDSKFFAIGDVSVDSNNEVTYIFNTKTNLHGNGKYIAKFTATDTAGNASVSQVIFTVDETKPTIEVKGSAFGNSYTPASIGTGSVFSKVNFKLSDNDKVVKAYVNGYEKVLTPSAWSDVNGVAVGAVGGQYGDNIIRVVDAAGNENTYSFTLDNKKPTVTLKTGSDTVGVGPYSKVSFKLYDEYKIAKAYVNDKLISLTADKWSDLNNITVNGAMGGKLGDNTVRVYDLAGNVTTYDFVLDNIAPSAPTLVTASPYIANGASKTLNWNASDSDDVAYYEYAEYNNVAPTADDSTVSWLKKVDGTSTTDTAWQSDVNIFWRVRAVDAAGNKSAWSETRKIVTDRTKPTVTTPVTFSDGLNAENVTVAGTKTFRVNQIENNPERIYVEYMEKDANGIWRKMIGQEFKNVNTADFTVDTTKWADGLHQVKISTRDIAGNASGHSFTFTVKNIADPAFVTITNIDGRVVNGTIRDRDATLEILQYRGVAGEDDVDDLVISDTVNEDGSYNWTFTVPLTYPAGESATLEVKFKNQNTGIEYDLVRFDDVTFSAVTPVGGSGDDDDDETSSSTGSSTNTNITSGQLLRVAAPITGILNPITTPLFGNTAGVIADATDTDGQANVATPEVLGAQDTNRNAAQVANPIDATSEGWKVFGVAWYWYVVLAALAAGLWWLIAGLKRRNNDSSTL